MHESVWVLGDQLLHDHPGLALGRRVVLIESLQRLRQRAYHKRKLGLILAAMRHYARQLRDQGYAVDLRQAPDFVSGLRAHLAETGSSRLYCMVAAEYDTRQLQLRLQDDLGIAVEVLPNRQFLVEQYPPKRSPKRLEPFYRDMRKRLGLLLDGPGAPEGGRWNYDAENRRRYDGRPVSPLPVFPPDEVTQAALRDVEAWCPGAIGSAEGFALPVTRDQALAALDDFVSRRLADFGPFEDAMSSREPVLFHSQLSPLVNIGLLHPREMCEAAVHAFAAGHAPLSSVEGFVRQVIGWREYIYYRYWEMMPGLRDVNAWEHRRALPAFFWSGETDMRCLRHAVTRALRDGYTHHIERLMLLCNFAMLAQLRPQDVNDWFMSCYIDAYEWVMLPNVLGMGLNADGGVMATKPYIASANYINRMSDYCGGCRYNYKARTGPNACPFNTLYWNFLIVNEARLRSNPRLGPAVLGLKRLDAAEREAIRAQADQVLEQIAHVS